MVGRWAAGAADVVDRRDERVRVSPGWSAWRPASVPQVVVPAGAWQAAEPLAVWGLVGCVVAPAFDFAGLRAGAAGLVAGCPGGRRPMSPSARRGAGRWAAPVAGASTA